MHPQAPDKPPLREQFTALGVEQLVKTFLDLQHNVFEAAGRFGLTLAELEEVLAWPEARELLDRAQRLSALRTQPALDLIFPCAIDRLASVMFDEQAPAEARRKSAALLARICETRRRDRRPRPAKPNPDSTPNNIPAPAHTPTPTPRETTTHDDIAKEPLPAPLLRYIPAESADSTLARNADINPGANHDNEGDDNNISPPRVRRTKPINLAPLATFPLVPRQPAKPEPTTLTHSSDTS